MCTRNFWNLIYYVQCADAYNGRSLGALTRFSYARARAFRERKESDERKREMYVSFRDHRSYQFSCGKKIDPRSTLVEGEGFSTVTTRGVDTRGDDSSQTGARRF